MGLAGVTRGLRNFFLRDARASARALCVHVAPGEQLELLDAAGWTVEGCGGIVWVTQEGDPRDVLLGPGERFTLDRDGKTLVAGLGAARFAVRPPAGALGRGLRLAPAFGAAPDARAPWLRALYPEGGPWNHPASWRRAGLL